MGHDHRHNLGELREKLVATRRERVSRLLEMDVPWASDAEDLVTYQSVLAAIDAAIEDEKRLVGSDYTLRAV